MEQLIDLEEPGAIVSTIDRAVGRLFGKSAFLVLGPFLDVGERCIFLRTPWGVPLGYVRIGNCIAEPVVLSSFAKLAGWALSRALPDHRSVRSDWLRAARKVVEEGLPQADLHCGIWEIAGYLRPAFHVGGDCFSHMRNDQMACFLLLDAVGHGIDSALLAASCRSLWRGVVYEKDLSIAIKRLNERLSEETGSERFVAATMGYCHADGSVEFVCCGQSPAFLLECGSVKLLPECEPPLGVYPEWSFKIQRVQLARGEGLVFVTDGVLEWKVDSRGMFGEEGILGALNRPLSAASEAIQRLMESLSRFAGATPPPDDVCALSVWRKAKEQ